MNILDIKMTENDAAVNTVGEYLVELLRVLWVDKESFSGKRPFGNSSWEYDLYKALITAGVVDGDLDSDGCVNNVNQEQADEMIEDAILSFHIKKE